MGEPPCRGFGRSSALRGPPFPSPGPSCSGKGAAADFSATVNTDGLERPGDTGGHREAGAPEVSGRPLQQEGGEESLCATRGHSMVTTEDGREGGSAPLGPGSGGFCPGEHSCEGVLSPSLELVTGPRTQCGEPTPGLRSCLWSHVSGLHGLRPHP